MPKSLITGGAGFIGSHICNLLIEQGHEVIIIDNLSTGSKKNLHPNAKFYEMDIQDTKISEVFESEKPDYIFHMAAQIDVRKSVENPILDAQVNILGSLNVLENAVRHNVKKIIFASTGGAIYGEAEMIPTPEGYYEKPLSPYGINKLSIEKSLFFYKQVKHLDYTILRLSNVYGPRQNSHGEAGVVAIFINKIFKKGKPVINGDGCQTRDYVFVKDVARAFINAMQETKSDIYNIGTGVETDVNQILEIIISNINIDVVKEHTDAKPGEQKRSCLNNKKALEELGWSPEYDVERGTKETVEWFKANQDEL